MQTKRLPPALALLLALLPASGNLWALGFGLGPQSVLLGQPLDITVPVRLESGEALTTECVNVEVQVGDQRLGGAQVRTRVDAAGADQAVIRVSTSNAIDEPVVTVNIAAGCSARVSRRFVMLADPGVATLAEAPTASALITPPAALAPVPADLATAAPAVAPTRATAPARATLSKSAADLGSARTAAAAVRRAAMPRQTAAAKPRAEPRPAPMRLAAVASPQPRLRLEAAELSPAPAPALVDEALEAVALAASAMRASASAASAAAERIANLERSADKLRGEASTSQAVADQLRAQLARAQESGGWVLPMLVVLALLVAAAAWLAWRLQAMQRAHELAWARASAQVRGEGLAKEPAQGSQTSPLPLSNSSAAIPPPLSRSAWADPPTTAAMPMDPLGADIETAARERATMRTAVLPPSARVDESAPRDVSIDELLDLEQQAEFFVALGQDGAAIDLLVAHLRNTGGGSPLTYLKLLEVYRRCGDDAAYERTRARFNQRYNAYAPDWGSDLMHGKTLDDYAGVIPRLQQAWPRPLDAMAELEALLFRKSRGELFELPAYREVLLLYSVARDLLDREPFDLGNVDLLLPLDPRAQAGLAVGSSRATSDIRDDDRPTSPVDLDLTPPPRQASIFGELLQPSPGVGPRRSRE